MLAKLYGSKAKPSVQYPKHKSRPLDPQLLPTFVPAGGKADLDYRNATSKRDVAVLVPKVGARDEVRRGFVGESSHHFVASFLRALRQRRPKRCPAPVVLRHL